MRNPEFAEWLYGYFALNGSSALTPKHLWIIKNHLNLVQAVEGQLDEDNRWLDEQIVALADGNIIQPPPSTLVQEIFARYGQRD